MLVGGQGGQLDPLTTAGYSKLGIPGNMIPSLPTFTDTTFGLAFHGDSAFLRGMKMRAQASDGRQVQRHDDCGAFRERHRQQPAQSRCTALPAPGAKGELLTLIGSVSSDSGGNSMAPYAMIDPQIRPTKVDRASDVTGLVDTGELGTLFPDVNDAVSVMESMAVLTHRKHCRRGHRRWPPTPISSSSTSAATSSRRIWRSVSPTCRLILRKDTTIVGPGAIFTQAEYDGDSEFRKTAAVMKMVIDGNAGAGTIQMGGFDYHTGDRMTGEARDLRAGQCMGACLEYAARTGKPLMIYVFSDGSLSSNGMIDNSVGGRGKGVWTGDNQSTASAFFLVFNPNGQPVLRSPKMNQIGWFSGDGSIVTSSHPGANAVNLLVEAGDPQLHGPAWD